MTVKPLLDATRDYISLREEEITRNWFDDFDWNLIERNLAPQTVSTVVELPEIIHHCGHNELRLVELFVGMANQLCWIKSYTAEDVGQYMVDHYGFVELIGERGHFVSNEIALGFVFFGRGVDYPNHKHDSEALYYPMSGTGLWSQDNSNYEHKAAGEIVFHEPNEFHALRIPENPLLALYVWRGGNLTEKGNF